MRLIGVIAVMPKVRTKMAASSGKKLNQELQKDTSKGRIKTLEAVGIRITPNPPQSFTFVASRMKPESKICYTLLHRLGPSGTQAEL